MTKIEAPDIVEHTSTLPFDRTVERLVEAITNAGMAIFATIDHAANARDVGMTMPPATVLIYGSPKGGTPIMLATPQTALDLPLHVLVQARADGNVVVAFHPVTAMLCRAGVPEAIAARLEPAQRLLIAAITA